MFLLQQLLCFCFMDNWKQLEHTVNWLKVWTETSRKYKMQFSCKSIVYTFLSWKMTFFTTTRNSLRENFYQLNRKKCKRSPSVFLLRNFLSVLVWILDTLYSSYGIVTSPNIKDKEIFIENTVVPNIVLVWCPRPIFAERNIHLQLSNWTGQTCSTAGCFPSVFEPWCLTFSNGEQKWALPWIS